MADYSEDPFQMDEDLPSFQQKQKNNQFHAPHYEEPHSIYNDDKYIRSQLAQYKLQGSDQPEENATETPEYEEDADDKVDMARQKQLAQEYRTNPSQELSPPENFSPVINQIYRLSFPQPNNFAFLSKLKLRSVLCLIPEEYPEIHQEFFENEGIRLFQLGMSGNKEPFVKIPHDIITQAIKIVINPENHPILIHCNRGKHRTGCLVGVLRRLQQWSLTIIFDEYRKFAAPKERPMDQQFIELYDATELLEYAHEKQFLPLRW